MGQTSVDYIGLRDLVILPNKQKGDCAQQIPQYVLAYTFIDSATTL